MIPDVWTAGHKTCRNTLPGREFAGITPEEFRALSPEDKVRARSYALSQLSPVAKQALHYTLVCLTEQEQGIQAEPGKLTLGEKQLVAWYRTLDEADQREARAAIDLAIAGRPIL